jgi:methyl-accepting chemotaxis protein
MTRIRLNDDLAMREMGVRHAVTGLEELLKSARRMAREAAQVAKDAQAVVEEIDAVAAAVRQNAGAIRQAHRRALEDLAEARGEAPPDDTDTQWGFGL